MGWKSAFDVRMSGLLDRTQTDVLEAIAAVKNEETGKCFPSTETIAALSRVSPNFVRRAIKQLEDAGYISSTQQPGGRRYFTLFLERLPKRGEDAEPLSEVTPLTKQEPLTKSTPLTNSQPLTKPLVDPCRNREGTPYETETRTGNI